MGTWFPEWLLIALTAMYAGITVTHLIHLRSRRGDALLWTGAHLLMAVGMLVMVLPLHHMLISGTPVVLVFAGAAAGCAAMAVRAIRSGAGSGLWFAATVDLAAMAYMFGPTTSQNLVLSVGLAVVLTVEGAYWANGYLLEVAEQDGLIGATGTEPTGTEPTGTEPTGTEPSTVRVATRGATGVGTRALRATHTAHALSLRVSMSLMAFGMAYMLLGMALGGMDMSAEGHVHSLAGT